jgi:RNA recognition motif-containing protein
MQLRLDRFTFHNDGRCFIEFSSEEQAQQAVRDLNKAQFMDHELSAVPLMDDFVWGPDPQKHKPRYFYEHKKSASEPLKPLLERRRMIFSVQTPGWGKKNKSTGHNNIASQIIDESFGKYGLEAVGGLQPFYGDKQPTPRFLCFLDFATKSGADQAAQAIHDTEIQGRRVWLKPSVLAPWRAHHIGKTEPALLAQLQEKGLAPKEVYEDSFVDSDRRKGKENYKTTRIERTNKRKAQRAETDA